MKINALHNNKSSKCIMWNPIYRFFFVFRSESKLKIEKVYKKKESEWKQNNKKKKMMKKKIFIINIIVKKTKKSFFFPCKYVYILSIYYYLIIIADKKTIQKNEIKNHSKIGPCCSVPILRSVPKNASLSCRIA